MNEKKIIIKKFQRANCIICNQKGFSLYTGQRDVLFSAPDIWNTDMCPKCKLLWLNPCPVDESISLLYDTYYTHNQLTNDFLRNNDYSSFPINKKIKYSILSNYYGYKIDVTKKYKYLGYFLGLIPGVKKKIEISIGGLIAKKGGKILDIGCGNGDFLLEMKYLGWDTNGIEIDSKSANLAKNYGLDVMTGILKKGTYPNNYFDAIHSNNVIEHLSNPEEIIKICYEILKPRGVFIIKTCSSTSLAHTYYKENYRGLEIPRHLFIFSPESLKKLGEKNGFKTIKMYTSLNQYIWFSSHKIKQKKENPASINGNKLITTILYLFMSILLLVLPNRGDDIFILFKKI